MIEVRFHGRGGQGAVTAAELLAQAAISEGKYAQGFPNFGPERRGAPVMAFFRVSDTQIYLREKIDTPDIVVVLDDSLLEMVDVCNGLKPGGTLLVNTPESRRDKLKKYTDQFQVASVDADRIAMDTLGVPIANTAIIGSLVKANGFLKMESMTKPINHRFGRLAEKNLNALSKAYDKTKMLPLTSNITAQDTVSDPNEDSYEKILEKEALVPWEKAPIGCDIDRPGSAAEFLTGNWRTAGKPVTNKEACTKCGFCWILCPDIAYQVNSEGYYYWNADYCKGCGVCVVECPAGAIEMEEES